jgi:hypothetical protein
LFCSVVVDVAVDNGVVNVFGAVVVVVVEVIDVVVGVLVDVGAKNTVTYVDYIFTK